MKNKFITLEGGEACGKSTQIERLKSRLESSGAQVVLTREPGGTSLGESIRHLLKFSPDSEGIAPESELLLFLASRAELVRKIVRPALARGQWVVSDRFSDSTLVYQGLARGLNMEEVTQLNQFAVGGLEPSLTILLDLPAEVARERMTKRQKNEGLRDRMEEFPPEFYDKVSQGYQKLAALAPDRIRLIQAQGSIEVVADQIWKEVSRVFSLQ